MTSAPCCNAAALTLTLSRKRERGQEKAEALS